MRCVAAILFCAGATLLWEPAVAAQQTTSLDKLPAAVSGFDDGQDHEPLVCTIHPEKPELNFGFRFQSGYTFEASLDPYLDGPHHWYIVFRVTPEGNAGPPVYFLDSLDLQPRSGIGLIGGYSGAFQTGEGHYHVRWALIDDLGRVCRQEWNVDAHLTSSERSEKVAMPPGTAGDFSLRSTESSGAVTKSRHVTILLNAAILVVHRMVFASLGELPFGYKPDPPNRWGMLLSMVSSIVEQMPEASFRVVAFDTEQQRELFRKDDFTAEDMNDVARVASAEQRGAVDYHSLQDPAGGWHLLRDLENQEINAPSPAETVIFLGVPGRFDKMPPGMPGPKTALRFFYLRYGPAPTFHPLIESGPLVGGPGGTLSANGVVPPISREDKPDLVEQSVQHLKGKSFLIVSPPDFSKALAAIRR